MRKIGIIAVLSLLLVAVTAAVASAASVHLKGGANAEPTFTDGGLFLSSAGELSGLGGGDVVVSLAATGDVTATCTNPAGATQPPGQNPADVTLTGTDVIPEDEIKNGNTPFDVATTQAVTPVPGAPECPNRQWTEDITDVAFTSAIITVEQPAGTLVLTVSCTFSPPTTNGIVPGSQVTCTQS
jgi:hypothetical protein